MTEQLGLFGPPEPVDDGGSLSPQQKAERLLEEFPDARGDDRLLMRLWWKRWDGLGSLFLWVLRDLLQDEKGDEELEVMAQALLERFETWFQRSATHPETIRRRRAEIQALRRKHGDLRPPAHIAAYRKARDGAGAPRR